MNTTIEQKEVIARKEHRCDWCGQKIRKGERYECQRYICDGNFYDWENHLSCGRIASAIWDYVDPDDGMSDQDFQDGCREICHCFVCRGCNNWDPVIQDCRSGHTYCIDKMDEFFETHVLYRDEKTAWSERWKVRQISE